MRAGRCICAMAGLSENLPIAGESDLTCWVLLYRGGTNSSEIRGFFASLRMTTQICEGEGSFWTDSESAAA